MVWFTVFGIFVVVAFVIVGFGIDNIVKKLGEIKVMLEQKIEVQILEAVDKHENKVDDDGGE